MTKDFYFIQCTFTSSIELEEKWRLLNEMVKIGYTLRCLKIWTLTSKFRF